MRQLLRRYWIELVAVLLISLALGILSGEVLPADTKMGGDFVYEWCDANTLLRGDECLSIALNAPRCGERIVANADLCVAHGLSSHTDCLMDAVKRGCGR